MTPEPADARFDAAACPPCRGTGRVVSNLGGEAAEVECPWCEGTGRFARDHDAQAARAQGGGGGP